MIYPSEFESSVLSKLLDGKHQILELLRKQFASCQVLRREFTGSGFYTYFQVDSSLAIDNLNCRFGDVIAEINDMPHGAGFLIYIENGCMKILEGYGYDDPWPSEVTEYKLKYLGGEERDLAKLPYFGSS